MSIIASFKLNNDELDQILSFLPAQDLLLHVQLVSKNFHHIITNSNFIWQHHCRVYFLSDLFGYEVDDENDTVGSTTTLNESSSTTPCCKYFRLFTSWAKSIPRVERVGRLPWEPRSNSGSEYERTIFSRFDSERYSFKHLCQLVIILNIFSLTKNGRYFYEHGHESWQDEKSRWCDMTDEVAFEACDEIPYDFVPSILTDNVYVSLSNMETFQFRNGEDILLDNNGMCIAHEIPFGAFCLMILSPKQEEKIKLIEDILLKRVPEIPNEEEEGEDAEELVATKNVLGVSNPNDGLETLSCVCYFNSMSKWFAYVE